MRVLGWVYNPQNVPTPRDNVASIGPDSVRHTTRQLEDRKPKGWPATTEPSGYATRTQHRPHAFADELAEMLYSHNVALRLRVNAHKLAEHPQEAAACFHRFAERLQQLHKKQGELRRDVQ